MGAANTVRTKRINLRLGGNAGQRIERAASVEGKTISAFVLASALEHAGKTIDRHETMVLARDATRFFHALDKPSPLNDRLLAALDEHERRVSSR